MRLQSASPGAPIFLGIECGGSHTVALAAPADGRLVGRAEAGPANLRLTPDRQLVKHFQALAARLPQPAALGIGMAGVLEEPERARVRAAAAAAWPGVPCWAGNDLETALATAQAFGEGPDRTRVLVLCGTGSCCYGQGPSGKLVRVGGWGHLLGDRGSAYDIGLSTLRAVMRSFDNTGRWPGPGASLLRFLLLNTPNDLVNWAQRATKAEMAGLAVEVFKAAAGGDGLARGIIQQAATTLARDASLCAARLRPAQGRVVFLLTGGVLLKNRAFARTVAGLLRKDWPHATIKPLPREGAWGAWLYARRTLAQAQGARGDAPAGRAGARRPQPRPGPPRACPIPESSTLSPTEQRNPRSMRLDRLPVEKAIRLMLTEDQFIPGALLRERLRLARAVRLITRALRAGGRLFYVGAGSSGRLGVLDASEGPPTFRLRPDQVQGIMAGGATALWSSLEGAEDDAEAGAQALLGRGVRRRDVVVGIAASGRTPFVWGALHQAKARGATTILLCFNPHLSIPRRLAPSLVIAPSVGPEVLTGSTRLKAGTATKLVLNLLTTLSMVRLGKVQSNLMVDLDPSNAKLRDRAIRIVRELTGADPARAKAALQASRWVVRQALRRLGPSRHRSRARTRQS